MKLATFTHDGATRIGVVVDDSIVDLAAAAPELPRDMTAFIVAGARAAERAMGAGKNSTNRIARLHRGGGAGSRARDGRGQEFHQPDCA